MDIELRGFRKDFGDVAAVDGIDLHVRSGELVAFLGPSGCGKTTTLLAIAGIYKPSAGQIIFDGKEVNKVQPKARNLGMVFQSYALYPHLTAYDNMVFPLKLKKVSEAQRRSRAERIAEMMGISELLDRRPGQLSGGQQQRIALGRALIKEPDALLFDEPLSNLDARLRLTMRTEIKRLQDQLGITSIYVTHDQVEAMTMASRVAVMNKGRLESYLSPDDTYNRPPTRFVASFVGNPPMNFIDVEVTAEGDRFFARQRGLTVPVDRELGEAAASAGGKAVLGLRPENLTAGGEDIRGIVAEVEPLGREDLIDVEVGDILLRMLAPADQRPSVGDGIGLTLGGGPVHLFHPETDESFRP